MSSQSSNTDYQQEIDKQNRRISDLEEQLAKATDNNNQEQIDSLTAQIDELKQQMAAQQEQAQGQEQASTEQADSTSPEAQPETVQAKKELPPEVVEQQQLVAQEASKRLNVPFGIIDLSLAPTPAVGDSVAEILEEIGLERAGAPGTTAALAMLNDQVKKGGVMASSYVGGLSGAFIPVSEDQGMIDAVNEGSLTIEKLEAMTCVCSVGLDMIAIPGDTPATTISGIIADEAAMSLIK